MSKHRWCDSPNDHGCGGDLQVFSPFSGDQEVVRARFKPIKDIVLVHLTQLQVNYTRSRKGSSAHLRGEIGVYIFANQDLRVQSRDV